MLRSQIIRQNQPYDALPDFRSLGVLLRAVLLLNGFGVFLALLRANSWENIPEQIMQIAAKLEPVLLPSMLLLYTLSPYLGRLSYRRGAAAAVAAVAAVSLFVVSIGGVLYLQPNAQGSFVLLRYVFLGAAGAALLLAYFRMRALLLSPAIDQARLQALQARIRPHFLFNCINTVLSTVRADPKRAETALEDMSDLFRMAMAHVDKLVPLKSEVDLARRYLALEQMRLGERLRVNWNTTDLPDEAMVPPLILQPLLENAVYHGIEPLAEGGEIDIQLGLKEGDIVLEISNPRTEPGTHHVGNRLALENIRERLSLLFDIEAQYFVETGQDFYRVKITMPYVKGNQG
ncbi:MAG TPA: histidine kinase [Gallionellaceae bacterium]